MLRKPLFSAVAMTCLVSSAFAADLPSPTAPPPAPYISPVPVATWTGFYIGVNAGATFTSIIALTPSSNFGPFPSGFASAQAIGAYHTS
ncbi:MAG TPA: hypothetical protein VFE89_11130 [Beijerinckiaceae bacterium]|nr:hypothetical protein [Beijerinckiaceae bacterium]